jgi:hypothetical protein
MILCDEKYKAEKTVSDNSAIVLELEELALQIFEDFVVPGADFNLPDNEIIR